MTHLRILENGGKWPRYNSDRWDKVGLRFFCNYCHETNISFSKVRIRGFCNWMEYRLMFTK